MINSRSPINVITFDLDDTLWDIEPVLVKAEKTVFNWLEQQAPKLTKHFNEQSLREWKLHIFHQHPELAHQISQLRIIALEKALLHVGYHPDFSKEYSLLAFDLFLQARHQVDFFDTVKPMLEKLKHRYMLGVLTNGNADISRLEHGHFFDFSFSAEQLNASKPASNHFMEAQKFSGVHADQIIHIGDHIQHDIAAALEAGCHAIWFNPKRLPNPQAVAEVHCLSEIPAAIHSIEIAASYSQ